MILGCHGIYEVRAILPATLEALEDFVERTRNIWKGCDARPQEFAAELLLREALVNAIVHGCGSDRSKSVRCVVRLGNHRLFFVVRDYGAGFDWRAAQQKQSLTNECCGRGLDILQNYASRIRYNRAGNQLAVIKHFG